MDLPTESPPSETSAPTQIIRSSVSSPEIEEITPPQEAVKTEEEEKRILTPILTRRRAPRPYYNKADERYMQSKRVNDPCYKLIHATLKSPFGSAKSHFRAVVSQQKLRRIITARLAVQQNHRNAKIFQDLLPNETDISIQMGAIAGYYGETVIEEDLVKFFGKFLPMYKPISDVVDHITPRISNKIQTSNFLWRNQQKSSGNENRPRRETSHGGGGGSSAHNFNFQFVSFKEHGKPKTEDVKTNADEEDNNKPTTAIVPDLTTLPPPPLKSHRPQALVNVIGEWINHLIRAEKGDEFISGRDPKTLSDEIEHPLKQQQGQFTTTLLDANYYYEEAQATHEEFPIEGNDMIISAE